MIISFLPVSLSEFYWHLPFMFIGSLHDLAGRMCYTLYTMLQGPAGRHVPDPEFNAAGPRWAARVQSGAAERDPGPAVLCARRARLRDGRAARAQPGAAGTRGSECWHQARRSHLLTNGSAWRQLQQYLKWLGQSSEGMILLLIVPRQYAC